MSRSRGSLRSHAVGRIARLGAVASLVIAVGMPATVAAAPPKAAKCSVSRLRYTHTSGTATFSTKVVRLNARGVKCTTARTIAGKVAKDLLNKRAIPTRIKGLAVVVKRPCAGCEPSYSGTATAPGKRVTFVIRGGA